MLLTKLLLNLKIDGSTERQIYFVYNTDSDSYYIGIEDFLNLIIDKKRGLWDSYGFDSYGRSLLCRLNHMPEDKLLEAIYNIKELYKDELDTRKIEVHSIGIATIPIPSKRSKSELTDDTLNAYW